MSVNVPSAVRPVPGADFVKPAKNGDGLRFYGTTSGSVGLKPAAVAGATDFTLPAADVAGCWVSNGSGVLSLESAGATRTRLGLATTDDVTFDDLTVTNLTVNGTTTTINSATLSVTDPLIKLATSNPADTLDVGFYGLYTSAGSKYAGLFRDASDGKFKLFTALQEEPTTTVNVAGTGYAAGYLVVGTIEATTYVGYPATAPAGVGTELQYRNGTAFGAVSGTGWNGSTLNLQTSVTHAASNGINIDQTMTNTSFANGVYSQLNYSPSAASSGTAISGSYTVSSSSNNFSGSLIGFNCSAIGNKPSGSIANVIGFATTVQNAGATAATAKGISTSLISYSTITDAYGLDIRAFGSEGGTFTSLTGILINGDSASQFTAFAGYYSKDNTVGPEIVLAKSRGDYFTPTAIITGTVLGSITGKGYSGAAGYVAGAQIRFESMGTIATTRVPGKIVFATATDAAPSVLTDRMTINSAGLVTVVGTLGATTYTGLPVASVTLAGIVDTGTQIFTGKKTFRGATAEIFVFGTTAGTSQGYVTFKDTANNVDRGYFGIGASVLTAAVSTDFVVRAENTLHLATGDNSRFAVNINGLVGINKSSSIGAQLHVVQSVTTTPVMILAQMTSSSVAALRINQGLTPTGNVIDVFTSLAASVFSVSVDGHVRMGRTAGSSGISLILDDASDNQSIYFYNSGTTRFRIGQNGTKLSMSSSSSAGRSFEFAGGTVDGTTGGHSATLFDISGTWNQAADVLYGIKLNITNTNSAAGSLLMDLQIGGVSKFSVTKDGDISAAAGTFSGAMRFGTHTAVGIELVTGYITIKDAGGTDRKLAIIS